MRFNAGFWQVVLEDKGELCTDTLANVQLINVWLMCSSRMACMRTM